MNILYFVHGFPPSIGAGALNAYKIVSYLSKFGHKIVIMSPGVFSKISPINILNDVSNPNLKVKYSSKLMKIPLNLIFSHFENFLKFIIKLKPNFNPDLILSQYQAFHYASVVGGYISKILKIPHVIRSHDIFFPTADFSLPIRIFHAINYTRIYRSILNCDIFYVTTSEMKKHYMHFRKLKDVNFKVHHNGIDPTQFYPFNEQEQLKSEYGCENLILFVGQISRDNDLKYILDVMPDILKRHKDTHFLIIGDGPHKGFLLKTISNNRLSNQVHFLGLKPHSEIPFYINNCDFGVGRITHNKIWRYMIPVKCLEYMACGKTFISAPLSNDLITNDDVGLTLKQNFTDRDIVNKMNILIEDKSLRKKMGETGLKKINKNFRWESLMTKFNENLLEIVKKS